MNKIRKCFSYFYFIALVLSNVVYSSEKSIGQQRTHLVQKMFLAQERDVLDHEDSLDLLPEALSKKAIDDDAYTQTEAFLRLKKMRELIEKTYNTVPYESIIEDALTREEVFKECCYVFYHGTDNEWRVAQDLYTQLYAYFKSINKALGKSFLFMRFQDESAGTAQAFLMSELRKNGLINDHQFGDKLLSVNFSLFANVGTPSECSWQYFLKSRDHEKPSRETYEKIMDKFGLSKKYINQIMALTKLYETKEQMLVQIFIPKRMVNEIGYVSWVRGIPAHQETIDWVKNAIKRNLFVHNRPAMESLAETFKKEKESNPLFKNLLNSVQKGDYALTPYLHAYRNGPERLENINDVSARLLFSPTVLLNPASGVKFFRYSTATLKQLETYHKRLNSLVDTLVAEKEGDI